jgi:hypothetical protein
MCGNSMMKMFVAAIMLLPMPVASGQSLIRIEESKIRAFHKSGSTCVSIPVKSAADHPIKAHLGLAWMGPQNTEAKPETREVTLQPGQSEIEVPLPLSDSSIWTRLYYSLAPDRSNARSFEPISGIVSLSHIADYVFEVKLNSPGVPSIGSRVSVFAQAVHPVKRVPIPDIEWNAKLSIEGKDFSPIRKEKHEKGFVEFVFDLPEVNYYAPVFVYSRCGDYIQKGFINLQVLGNHLSGRIQSDKPIYQPGQTMHLRAVILDAKGQAATGARIKLCIRDPDHESVHTAHLVSSKFGIVQDEWTFPAAAVLGDYQIELFEENGKGEEQYLYGDHVVRLSRYELPAFNITAKTSRIAYLPGEQPRVTIAGAYLFGKPVPGGEVKIVRSKEPCYFRRNCKVEPSETTVVEGNAGKDGKFVAQLDLKEDQKELSTARGELYRDIPFTAYFKDRTSGRTEQVRFDVRITREPLHIYFYFDRSSYTVPVYVSVSYADGRPASADVAIIYNETTTRVHTNRYGVAKASLPHKHDSFLNIDDSVKIKAVDTDGKTGTLEDAYYPDTNPIMQIKSGRTLYKPGESVVLKISSPPEFPADQSVMIHALSDQRIIASRIIRIENHKGEATFPYQPDFRRNIQFVAWNPLSSNDSNWFHGSKEVIFPDTSELKILAASERAAYQPGEKASLRMRVSSADGKPAEAALGVTVVDQAVLERARTDGKFGRRTFFGCEYCSEDQKIGGVALSDLHALKPSSSISTDLDLVAEAFAVQDEAFVMTEEKEFPEFKLVESQKEKLKAALESHYLETHEFPKDISSLAEILGQQWTQLRDPWGMPYSAIFGLERSFFFVRLLSAGADKQLNTSDDFVAGVFEQAYFAPVQHLIEKALKNQNCPATEPEFIKLLNENGIAFSSFHDPWGTAYQANIRTYFGGRLIRMISAGPDRTFSTGDDIFVADLWGPYFLKEKAQIETALRNAHIPPQTREEFLKLLENAGFNVLHLLDNWDRPYLLLCKTDFNYIDRITAKTVQMSGGQPVSRQEIVPITQKYIIFSIHSLGPDGMEDTSDDFEIAQFPVLLKEESAQNVLPSSSLSPVSLDGKSMIMGIVKDPKGAVIRNATVTLVSETGTSYVTRTSLTGAFQFLYVPEGVYSIKAERPSFITHNIAGLHVAYGKTANIDIELDVENKTGVRVVETAGQASLSTNTMGSTETKQKLFGTPRVREYFPETLLWIPELITDAKGSASADIPPADSVTNWKIAVVASTQDGRIAETESSFRTFKPFSLDFNPPPVLTEGDRIELPVVVRNYQDKAQKASVILGQNGWSTVQYSPVRQITVQASQSVNVGYSIQAKHAIDRAVQRITASAGKESDAIEKSLRIHPNGREITHTSGDIITGPVSFPAAIPQASIAGATRGELRIYPNTTSLLMESASAIMAVPRGCAEQAISAGYANLTAWQFAHAAGLHDEQIEKRAFSNINHAIDALERNRNSGGGISYWKSDESDIAVTAYALSFLLEASAIVPVDKKLLESLASWLEKQQTADGRWQSRIIGNATNDRQALLLTGTVAKALAAAHKAGIAVQPATLGNAYHHLAKFTDSIDEPYMLANFILMALDTKDESLLGNAVSRLAAMAREERGGLYWDLQTNSPFYGWGTAGRYEATGLAVSALSAWRTAHPESKEFDAQIRLGLVFLLRGRSRSGMWLSTQSTVRVMRALADAAQVLGGLGSRGGTIEIRSNGKTIKTIKLSDDATAADPVLVDLSSFLAPGDNQIAVEPTSGTHAALAFISSTYWLPWEQTKPAASPELRFDVKFDQLKMRVGDAVRCSVKAERVGFRGYGMMLAEIGLPPGAEVDRASLESVIQEGSLGIDHYEILPDRVVLYLWTKAGGASFNFQLSARFPMNAQSEPSVLYDYYNPEARSELLPFQWTATK